MKDKLIELAMQLLSFANGSADTTISAVESDKVTTEGVQVRKAFNSEQRRALFVVMEPQNEDGTTNDLHGDWFSEEDVVEACRSFNVHCMKANLMHNIMVDADKAVIEQSYCSPVAFDIERPDGEIQHVKKNAWLQEWHIPDDEIWEGLLNGDYVGLSPFCDALGYELNDD